MNIANSFIEKKSAGGHAKSAGGHAKSAGGHAKSAGDAYDFFVLRLYLEPLVRINGINGMRMTFLS